MNIKKAIVRVFSANFIQVIVKILINFVVPSILTIQGYADLKTYTLYMSYVGFFHFGFLDGLYIKYGGKKIEDINKNELKGEHLVLVIVESLISLLMFLIGLVSNNMILMLFGISILPSMLSTFFGLIYQSTGEFKKYTRIMHICSFSYLILNLILVFVLKSQNYIYYCLASMLANLISIVYFELKFVIKYKNIKSHISTKIFDNIKIGFFILLGNLSVIGLFGIDKWFVKLFLTTQDFAYYSFAVSMLSMVNILINAISITFYNYLFTNNNEKSINKLKKYLITLGGGASLGFFALSFIVNYFIKKYIPALDIIAITFAVFPYMVLINALYVNLYKVNKNEKKYFKVVVSMLLISIIYNVIAILIFKNTISIALMTILTLITWVIYSTHDLKNVTSDKKMYIYMFSLTAFFLFCSKYLNWWLGGFAYLVGYVALTYILNKEVIIDVKDIIANTLKKIAKN